MLLEARDVSFTYPSAQRPALEGVSLSVERGAFVTVCGASGCGKSTLLHMLKPCLMPRGAFSGSVRFCGEELSALDPRRAAAEIGFVAQDPEASVVTDRVWHEIAFGAESVGTPPDEMRRRVAECAEYFGLERLFDRETAGLSGGEKQLVSLAAAAALHPKLLLLDEPTSQLDPIAARSFIDALARLNREFGTAVVITEHRLEELLCISDSVVIMERGRVIADCPPREIAEALPEGHEMSQALPVAARLYRLGGGRGAAPLTVREGAQSAECRAGLALLPEKMRRARVKGEAPVLSARELWVSYGKGADALRSASLSLMQGEIYVLLGGNGSGKTTLLKALAGLVKPLGGRVKAAKGARLAYLPQDPLELLSGDTALGALERLGVRQGARELLCEYGFSQELFGRHPADLSGGERQRLALCGLIAGNPDVLLLDEPTKGMDAPARERFAQELERLSERGCAVLFVTHDADLAERCADTCGLLFGGEVTSEAPADEFFTENYFYTTPLCRLRRLVGE